jgi:short-subunit dehydrogenase
VEILVADLSAEADVERVAERLASEQELVLLVNNAGFGTRGRFWEAPLAPQEEMHRLHVMAPLKLMHSVLPRMVARDYGAIINVASVAAFVRQPGGASYAATKTWMTTFTEAIYLELRNARSSVTVQALCPGYTYSEFHDKLGLDRGRIAPRAFWLTAEGVVEASLQGLKRKQLFVIPGWRYRLLVGVLTKLPTALRIAIESSIKKRKTATPLPPGESTAQLGKSE